MSVVTLTNGTSQAATAGDAGKMFILTGSETLVFNNVNLTGRRFEFFNYTGSAKTIQFGSGTTVNGASSATISVSASGHVVVMGIGAGGYIAWFSAASSPA
jgi:hypothetical protein